MIVMDCYVKLIVEFFKFDVVHIELKMVVLCALVEEYLICYGGEFVLLLIERVFGFYLYDLNGC